MSQHEIDNFDPSVRTGVDLQGIFNALHSLHSGAARPSYAQAGMLWVKEVSAARMDLMIFDGAADHLIIGLDPAAGEVVAAAPFLRDAATLGGVAAGQFVRSDVAGAIAALLTFTAGARLGEDGVPSKLEFWDEDAQAWRALFWDDVAHDWRITDAGGVARKLWHGGNQGAGSGLDADTLDGYHGGAYLRAGLAGYAKPAMRVISQTSHNTSSYDGPYAIGANFKIMEITIADKKITSFKKGKQQIQRGDGVWVNAV